MTDLCSEASELTVVLKEAVEIPILSVDFFFKAPMNGCYSTESISLWLGTACDSLW